MYVAGNKISTQTGIGTCIAIAGVAIYSFIKAKMEEEKRVSPKRNTRKFLFQIYQNEYTKESICCWLNTLGSFDSWLELCSYQTSYKFINENLPPNQLSNVVLPMQNLIRA